MRGGMFIKNRAWDGRYFHITPEYMFIC
jgi:hypothetical protein